MKYNIGIIGQGFVGNAIYQKFKNYFDVATFDLDETKRNTETIEVRQGQFTKLYQNDGTMIMINDKNILCIEVFKEE